MPDRKNFSFVAIAGLACAASLLVACGQGAGAPIAEAQALPAGAAQARRGDLQETLLLTGELRADEGFEAVVPRTPNWQVQVRWLIEDGTEVAAGDRLVELDNSSFAGDLEERKLAAAETANQIEQREAELAAQVAEARQGVAKSEAELIKARAEADVPPELLSRREAQERALAARRAELELAKARDELAAQEHGAEVELAEQRLSLEADRREIAVAESAIAELTAVAPYPGIAVVSEHPWEGRKLQEGDSVWVGLPLVRLPDLESMVVEAFLPDVDDGRLEVGAAARLTLDAYPHESFSGTVREMAQIARQERGDSLRYFFRVVIEPDQVDADRMRPGMSVKVEARGRSFEDALLVPRSAVTVDAAGQVWVTLAGAEPASVELGPCDRDQCVVLGGLDQAAPAAADQPSGAG
jgi:multidrug efflux pump subunit AcrA (membrane-fusion protein)